MIKDIKIINLNKDSFLIKDIVKTKLLDLECKHIPCKKESNEIIYSNSIEIGYQYIIFGSHRNNYNLFDEIKRINNMATSTCERAARIVITKDGKIWSDNTHWTIAYIIKYGENTTLRNIPMYIVDLRPAHPLVINCENTLFENISDIYSAVSASLEIQKRIDKGWRKNIIYKICDFLNDLEGTWYNG